LAKRNEKTEQEAAVRESDLYAPVKNLLESRGYEVKAEVRGCDVVAQKHDERTVIVELKLNFSLELILQGINRLSLSDDVYLAILAPDTPAKRKNWRARQRGYLKLLRRLGMGLILVHPKRKPGDQTNVLLDPAPYAPRKSKRRQTRLQAEFTARVGDPNTGGVTRRSIVTAYRQDALRCAAVLDGGAELPVAEIKARADVDKAGRILQKNHYGWFERRSRGVYGLTPLGQAALVEYAAFRPDP